MDSNWTKISLRTVLKTQIENIIKKQQKEPYLSLDKISNPTQFIDIAVKEKLLKLKKAKSE